MDRIIVRGQYVHPFLSGAPLPVCLPRGVRTVVHLGMMGMCWRRQRPRVLTRRHRHAHRQRKHEESPPACLALFDRETNEALTDYGDARTSSLLANVEVLYSYLFGEAGGLKEPTT
ncbi:unnamed protein product, partial [Hapterophycus canaliculatus]